MDCSGWAGGTDSASGGSGGSGMECMQLRSPPGPFHYLISEQAKSFVALQELQNEVGALLEFRDLVIETFPNLRSKMSPSGDGGGAAVATAGHGGARDWEPGVRVRRKLAAPADSAARAKPQPSVQDSGFSTETSCKDAHSSSSGNQQATAAPASPPPPTGAAAVAPLEDELWALLDVIQRKGGRLRDDVELLRDELDPASRSPDSSAASGDGAEERFARALAAGCPECGDARRLRRERDALLARTAELAAAARAQPAAAPPTPATPLGRLDRVLSTPSRPLRVHTPDSKKFAAILQESNPVELQRHLLTSTVQTQVLLERLQRLANHRALLLDRLERTRDENDDLKFQLEEKSIELEGTKAKMRLLETRQQAREGGGGSAGGGARDHSSMRDMQPLRMPDEPAAEAAAEAAPAPSERITETPKRGRRSRIPLAGHRGRAAAGGARDSGSYRSRGADSQSWRASLASSRSPAPRPRAPAAAAPPPAGATRSSVPVRRAASAAHAADAKVGPGGRGEAASSPERAAGHRLVREYVARSDRLLRRLRIAPPPARPHSLALELSRSLLYAPPPPPPPRPPPRGDALWSGRPQLYFESMSRAEPDSVDGPDDRNPDSLAC